MNMKLKEIIKTPSWSAVVLDNFSKNKLLSIYPNPGNWKPIAHHMTIDFKSIVDDSKIGNPVILKVTSVGISEKAMAVKVSGYDGKTNNKFPHVTLYVNELNGGKPKDSNEIINWTKVENGLTLHGTIQNL